MMRFKKWLVAIGGAAAMLAEPVTAQGLSVADADDLRRQIAEERTLIEAQRQRIEALERRLGAQRPIVAADASPPPAPPAAATGVQVAAAAPVPVVGEAPTDQRQIQVAALSEQGGIITQRGRLTLEADFEYARADRNRVLFRGIAIPEAVLIGAFDINESRQDVLTAAGVVRFGLTNRFELNARVPFVRRSDNSALAPVVNDGTMTNIGIDRSVGDSNLGDVDFGARYQLANAGNGWPYLIVGVQAVAPTGTDPFKVRRDTLGNPLSAATGAGFWGVTPNLTAILPTDPAVLFATLGYTVNIGRNIGQQIGSAIVDHVRPGDAPAASLGIAISLNPRTSLSFGYAHTMAFGTRTRLRTIDPRNGAISDSTSIRTRDLQLGRLLFGVSYRTSPRTTINWNVEVGATDDATDLRTTLRIPFVLGL